MPTTSLLELEPSQVAEAGRRAGGAGLDPDDAVGGLGGTEEEGPLALEGRRNPPTKKCSRGVTGSIPGRTTGRDSAGPGGGGGGGRADEGLGVSL